MQPSTELLALGQRIYTLFLYNSEYNGAYGLSFGTQERKGAMYMGCICTYSLFELENAHGTSSPSVDCKLVL